MFRLRNSIPLTGWQRHFFGQPAVERRWKFNGGSTQTKSPPAATVRLQQVAWGRNRHIRGTKGGRTSLNRAIDDSSGWRKNHSTTVAFSCHLEPPAANVLNVLTWGQSQPLNPDILRTLNFLNFSKLQLTDDLLVATGQRRNCYHHPDNPDKCVKVSHLTKGRDMQARRETREAAAACSSTRRSTPLRGGADRNRWRHLQLASGQQKVLPRKNCPPGAGQGTPARPRIRPGNERGI